MKKITAVFFLLIIPLISLAQSKHPDPRPLKGLDASKIPQLKSLRDLKAAPGSLTKNAVQIGKAEYVTLNVSPMQQAAKDAKDHPTNTISIWRVFRAANGTANWMWRSYSKPSGMAPQSVASPDGMSVLQGLSTALRIADPKSEFYPMSSQTDEVGCKHLRYGQIYKGVPVWNRDLYIHFDASGQPYTINGTYEPTPTNISTVPAITNPYSIILTIADLKAQGKWAPVGPDVAKVLGYSEPTARLVLFPDKSDKLHLAYEVSIIPNLLESYYYVIDATSGDILDKIARQCSVMPIDPKMKPVTIANFSSQDNNTPSQVDSGFADASGTDLNGTTQALRTYQHTDGKFYTIWDLPSLNAGASTLPNQPSGGAITLSANNADYDQNTALFHNTSTNNSWSDPAVVSAHHNMLVTYNYYNGTFGRKAIDDKNGVITSIVHVTQGGVGMDNAFWTGSSNSMIYGDGHTSFKPLAGGIDVAGHEMTHGVINATCNLVYQDQSGALNESFADVFGVMVDTRNLTVGEDIMMPGQGTCLRDLDNPNNPNGLAHQPGKMSNYVNGTDDNGGVHTNSGIPSKACAILIGELGRDKVQKIYYLAMTKYLTRNSQFVDCRLAIQAAAKELFGATSTEFNDVGPAFDAVEITGPGTNPSGDDIPAQTGGTSIIAFTNNAGDIGLLNPSTGQAQLVGTTGSTARVSTDGSSRAQLSAPRSGIHLWYVDPSKHLGYLELATGKTFTFPNLHLQADGDLWNASVSPDESYVALTSAYTNDPNIYIFDGTTIFTQPLTPQSTDGGAVASIDYPDVISFSPNVAVPKISFDALLDANIGGTSVQYWSMYEINYTSKKIYDLIPSQTSDIDLGNVAYSSLSPNMITFNSLLNGNDEDVWIADFRNNNIGFLGVDQHTISGNPVLDAQKPSFSPDDQYLTFASPSNSSLLFYQLPTQALTYVTFATPVYQPYWFLVGGSGVQSKTNAVNAISLALYPSITSSEATASITLSGTEEVALDIVNIYGMTVRPITKVRLDQGSHDIKFNTEGLSSGTYLIRLAAKDGQRMEKIVVER